MIFIFSLNTLQLSFLTNFLFLVLHSTFLDDQDRKFPGGLLQRSTTKIFPEQILAYVITPETGFTFSIYQ